MRHVIVSEKCSNAAVPGNIVTHQNGMVPGHFKQVNGWRFTTFSSCLIVIAFLCGCSQPETPSQGKTEQVQTTTPSKPDNNFALSEKAAVDSVIANKAAKPEPVFKNRGEIAIPVQNDIIVTEKKATPNSSEIIPGDSRTITSPGKEIKPEEKVIFQTSSIGDGTETSLPEAADVQASYPGGMNAFYKYVEAEFQYPVRCLDAGISGYALLRFIVDTHGKISNVTIVEETPSCKEFTQEAIRVLLHSKPWIPGMVKGRIVKSYRTVPIKLNLESK